MTDSTNVLVTATGGDLGQAIVKALRVGKYEYEIHGADAESNPQARAFVDTFHNLPYASDRGAYEDALERIVTELGVDVVLPGSDAEIYALGEMGHVPSLPSGCPVVCQPPETVQILGDKLRCMESLSSEVEIADFADGNDREAVRSLVESKGFPLVVKPRLESGSAGVQLVEEENELIAAIDELDKPMVQDYLSDDQGEFTTAVYRTGEETVTITFQRELGPGGSSWKAETVTNEAVDQYAKRIGKAAEVQGSINVQTRSIESGVRLLEINPRFSSLSAARSFAGFRDVEWALLESLNRPIEIPSSFGSIRFHRFLHERIDIGEGFETVARWAPRDGAKREHS